MECWATPCRRYRRQKQPSWLEEAVHPRMCPIPGLALLTLWKDREKDSSSVFQLWGLLMWLPEVLTQSLSPFSLLGLCISLLHCSSLESGASLPRADPLVSCQPGLRTSCWQRNIRGDVQTSTASHYQAACLQSEAHLPLWKIQPNT